MAWKIVATVALIAGTSAQALAQSAPPPPAPPAQPTAARPDGMDVSRATREQQEGFDRLVRQGVKVTNVDENNPDGNQRVRRKAPVAALASDLTTGAAVRDKDGLQIATVERLEDDGAVVRTGDRLAKLPLDAFGKDDDGLLLGITASEFHTAIAQSSVPVPVPQEPQTILAATAEDMTPGAAVRDIEGVPIGTVDALIETGVIVLTEGRKVKLAVDSFAKDENGLMIGITASEFKAIIGGSAPTDG